MLDIVLIRHYLNIWAYIGVLNPPKPAQFDLFLTSYGILRVFKGLETFEHFVRGAQGGQPFFAADIFTLHFIQAWQSRRRFESDLSGSELHSLSSELYYQRILSNSDCDLLKQCSP